MSKDLLSQNIVEMPQSGIRKFFDIIMTKKDVLSLVIGEPDFQTPMYIRQACIGAIIDGKTHYTSNWGIPEFRKAVADYLEYRFGISYNYENEIVPTIGASEAIDLAFRSTLNPGDEVLVPDPSFVSYNMCIKMAYGVSKRLPTYEKDSFKVTAENLEKAITPKTKMLVLSYPSNPTGAIMTKEELMKLVPIIVKHDLIVIADEIYAELTYGCEHTSIAALPGMKERTILISGFSKAFAMTGMRIGYVCANKEITFQMIKIRQSTTVAPATPIQYACVTALNDGRKDDYSEVSYMREKYDERRRYISERLKKMGLPAFEPQGAFYIFPSVQKTGLSGYDFAIKAFEKYNVAMVPGNAFGVSGENYVRMSYATSIEKIAQALDAIEKMLSEG
ncbi:MAG: aminotransferase class I/II-fold pyridoxal phosphate-dependent enzyme [Clostridia bacterium]|nr:aminotransferase class I/II-fold pyridoxal phosphate-dependent enzyme [Clostridia bacterium]